MSIAAPSRFGLLFRTLAVASVLALGAGDLFAGKGRVSGKEKEEDPPEVRLGERLFIDPRFSSPDGDMRQGCRTCHLLDEDPRGLRAYVDFLARSWVPWRSADPRREGARNSPTLLDSALMPRLHMDGEFTSLDQLIKRTLSTRNLGWLPGEEQRAFDQAFAVLLADQGEGSNAEGTYVEQFKKVYGVDLSAMKRDEAIDWVARSITDYLKSLTTKKNAPYDEFIEKNALDPGPKPGEDVRTFATRLMASVEALEKENKLRLTKEFGREALAGMKIFYRTEGAASVGNCAACHAPPAFTDFSFHNTGESQAEYDIVHGEGAFAALKIPGVAEARRPLKNLADRPLARYPAIADLGHWNFVDLQSSSLRGPNETDAAFLDRMIATFKTPTLRSLGFTQAYMHNGQFDTLDAALAEIVHLNSLARSGRLRSVDPEYTTMNLSAADIAPLVAFLVALDEKYD